MEITHNEISTLMESAAVIQGANHALGHLCIPDDAVTGQHLSLDHETHLDSEDLSNVALELLHIRLAGELIRRVLMPFLDAPDSGPGMSAADLFGAAREAVEAMGKEDEEGDPDVGSNPEGETPRT